jgi:hypothetical protein
LNRTENVLVIVRSEKLEGRSVKIVIRGFGAFPGEIAGFVSGYSYLESVCDLQTTIFHSSLLPPGGPRRYAPT